jgi:hypothetical protein
MEKNNYLKTTGVFLNNVFRPQENKNTFIQYTGRPSKCCYMVAKLGLL